MTVQHVTNLISSLRPRQWLKNLVVFAAIFFSKELFYPEKFWPVLYTLIVFCAASSSMYLLNDIIDREHDKQHFSKKDRPIASGKISVSLATTISFILSALALTVSYQIQTYLFFIVLTYIVVQLLYSFLLKGVIILDVLAIAFSFMLRIFAGSIVVLTPLSSWLILTTMMLALLLAIGKRRSEFTLLNAQERGGFRKTLISYPPQLLDGLVLVMSAASLITYSLFTFNSPEAQVKEFFTQFLPSTLATPKLLMVTIPIVIYGIFRYLYLVFEKGEGESPEKILVSDQPLLFSVVMWLLVAVFLLYFSTL